MPRGVWLIVYPGVSLCVILVIKEEPFSLWRDFGSPNQGISSLKSDFQGFPGGSVVKNLPANAGQTDSIPHLGRSHMPQSN